MISNRKFSFFVGLCLALLSSGYSSAAPLNLANKPLFLGSSAPPLLMLTVGKDHKLYYEAYNDASDLNNDGILDVGYNPDIDYYGYFNSYACYDYDSTNGRFVPQSVKSDAEKSSGVKTCNAGSGSSAEYAGEWSGDFLNYVTMARIDALRKVFYGGKRSTDTAGTTVLERTHIPQDAHTWAKEYRGYVDVDVDGDGDSDGYYIDELTPLAQPPFGKGHMFGNVSYSVGGDPLVRVLPNTVFRPWEWASIERPVLGDQCVAGVGGSKTNCEVSSGDDWQIAEAALFNDLSVTYYDVDDVRPSSPSSAEAFDDLLDDYESGGRVIGSADRSLSTIQGGLDDSRDHYFSVVRGEMIIPATGSYTFSVDGDDAVEFLIKTESGATVLHRLGWYGAHGNCGADSCRDDHDDTFSLIEGTYQVEFRHHEQTGGDSFSLHRKTETSTSEFSEYAVRVEVCKSAGLLEDNCKTYSDGTDTSYKPTGLLHDYGENESILFGLLTGSYENNLDGGVLRKNISSFQDEVNSDDGTFTSTNGIVSTLSALRTVNFNTSNHQYSCGFITNRPIVNGECDMWGNPIAEMMYETVRYFSGKSGPTAAFDIADSGNNDSVLGLPKPAWVDPYDETDGQPYCAAPYNMVVSDVNVSYDSDKVPGSAFSSFTGDVTGLDVSALSSTITDGEPDVPGLHYIGQSGTVSDNAPTAKSVEGLANIRGLAPEEPTKLGSYYSAAIGYHGWLTDLFPDRGSDDNPTHINTFAVALASPLPRINIPVGGGQSVSLVPFAKSPGGAGITAAEDDFQPTNQIVDFYVENISATSGSFLINFEDVEQGADHDMDAIARSQYNLNGDGTVTVKVDSLYAAGGIDQHMGYVISGTSKDGTYLVVHDRSGRVPTYYLDTPAERDSPGDARGTEKLTLSSERVFTPSGDPAATLLKDPLYFAAKWGGFIDKNDNDTPDLTEEWDAKNNITQEIGADGVPDNYFQVTNALGLKDQLSTAFNTILAREASSSTVTVNSGELNTDTLLFQATFNAEDWSGDVVAYPVEDGGLGSAVWNFKDVLNNQVDGIGWDTGREIITYNTGFERGVKFRWPSDPDFGLTFMTLGRSLVDGLKTGSDNDYGEALLEYIRGNQDQEGPASTYQFRERETVLGDIVNSDPLYVPQPGFFYPDNWGPSAPENAEPYSDFRNAFKDREPVLYFGANDGLFHAINAYKNNSDPSEGPTDGGEEILAYMPAQIASNLNELADPNYTHQYFVDGPSTYGDVFFAETDEKWHTALVGALGKGGQGLFALDITDPKGLELTEYPSFDESDAADLVLWEWSDADDADMGYSYGDPVIVRMNNGEWAAVFANGYNNTEADGNVSATGNAVLYVVNIETGDLIRKFDTGAGLEDDPLSESRPNGLASPAVIDKDGDYIADAIYAGDLFGNMWKIDVSGETADSWGFAYEDEGDPEPMFVARDGGGEDESSSNRLPITSRPAVGSHPDPSVAPGEVIVYFGTGKYLESNDNDPTGQDTQAFFAIWDDGSAFSKTDGRSQLLQQAIIGEATSGDFDFRFTTDNEIRWKEDDSESPPAHRGWFMDLVNTEEGGTDNKGERVVFEPQLRNDRVIFTTLIPSLDECAAGGSGWLMELSAISGSRLEDSPFDVNDDGVFNDEDLVDFDGELLPTSGIRKSGGEDEGSGIPTPPAILDEPDCPDGVCSERKFTGTSKATIESIRESSGPASQGRQNWREVN